MMATLIDTCILIDHCKGKPTLIPQVEQCRVNDIIILELLQGAQNKPELTRLLKWLVPYQNLEMLPEIFALARELMITYTLSHNAMMADTLIAATALIYDVPLLTYNTKDFAYIPGIKLA